MKIEAVLLFDDDDFEAQTGVKKEEDIEFDDSDKKPKKGQGLTSPDDTVSQSEASYAEESSTRR